MLQELWSAVRGKTAPVPEPKHHEARLPDEDEPESIVRSIDPPAYEAEPISGFSCIVVYRDSRGRESERRITCQRLDRAASQVYLYAYCHEREAVRQFKLSRIASVADMHTGEVLSDVETFFARFRVDREQKTGLSWGLSVRQRADLIAGLNALVFMGRCDKHWHPLERDALEAFVVSYWLRAELNGDPPLEEIAAHADRLSPDAETFYVSLMRCHENPLLARIIRRHLQTIIEADGRICDEELYWGSAVDAFFARLTN